MKNILKYIYGLMVLAVLLSVASCQEDLVDPVNITDVSVTSLYQGEDISLTGEGFDQVQFLFLGNEQLDYTLEENTITFTVPDTYPVGMATITLAMKGARRETQEVEVLLKPTPVIGPFTPFVPVGEDVTITGTSLDNNTIVAIDGVPATIVSVSDTELVVTVPNGVNTSGAIEIEVTTDYGTDVTPTAFYAMENLLANSDLEAGEGDEFTDWEQLNNGDVITELLNGYGGTRSIHVAPTGANPWSTQMASTGVPLTMGAEYTIVMWAKADNAGAFMRVSASQYDGAGADYFYGADQEIAANAWQQYTWTFTVGKDLPTHRVVLDMGAGSVPFAIDHIGLVPGVVGEAGAIELLTNSGFEDGLTDWDILNGSVEASAEDAYCGAQSLKAVGTGGNHWDVQVAVNPDVAPTLDIGTMYELGFWAKAGGADGVMRASVSRWASGQSDDFFYTPEFTVAEDWTYYSFVFEAAATSTGVHQVVMDFGSTTQTFYIDEVSLKEYDPTSLYANGDFEDGFNNWSMLNGTVEVTTAEAYEGTSSLMATGTGGNHWDIQVAADAVALTEGQDYKLSFWAKAAGPDGVIRASVSRWASGQSDDFFYTPEITVAEEWTYYSYVFTAAATSTGDHQVVLDFGSTAQTFYLDKLVIEEFDSCE
ncbi:carbohydrate binding domain-containing protein [Reichenbachiella ulvae]|uniref:Carbohydrate binding domain-containing protein n=1 Tax=Reichenbachiella ulvae TaxID=2980104 RepID=A0ABT3CSX0_9BACT|nr:carbohydrate binding domain-containing protein [Reichenbachiella ulvae]MCV9386604.1 carbohydrate binding domain-containing protein [Reichenbachiella ulvae]